MGKYIFIIALIFLFGLNSTISYSQQSFCGMSETSGKQETTMQLATLSHTGGKYITAQGTITSFVLFVRFSDDNETTIQWPNATVLPTWAQNILNPYYIVSGNYTSNSFSDYLCKNSYKKMHMIGDVYYVTLPQTESYYYNYSTSPDVIRQKIQIDALDKLALIPGIDLHKYDNWKNLTLGEEYGAVQAHDNIVDLCWIVLRNLHDGVYSTVNINTGIALLYASKTIGGVTINSGFPGYNSRGSGISFFSANFIDQMPKQTVIQMKVSEIDNDGAHDTFIGTMIHELSHYFFGGSHFGIRNLNQFSTKRSSSDMKPYACNAAHPVGNVLGYEKIRLGWITSSEIKVVTAYSTFTLQDMATATSGYKIAKIPIDANQAIYIENRSWVSPYEARYVPENFGYPLKPGILAYLIPIEYDDLASTPVQQICADGKWDWVRLSGSGSESPADVIDKLTPNSYSGYDEKEWIYISAHPLGKWLAGYWHDNFGANWGAWYKGDTYFAATYNTGDFIGDDKDLFGVGEVITKWSNGASHKRNSASSPTLVATNIGIEIGSFNPTNSSYSIEVRTSQPELLSPSKPHNLKVSENEWDEAVLTWAPNTESDIISGGKYKIYRADVNGLNEPTWEWELAATIDAYVGTTPTTTWTDDQSYINNGPRWLHYKISALDNTLKESATSEKVKINGKIPKINKEKNEEMVYDFNLLQNSPKSI